MSRPVLLGIVRLVRYIHMVTIIRMTILFCLFTDME